MHARNRTKYSRRIQKSAVFMLAISHALCAALAIAVADVQHIQGGQGAPAVGADPTAAEKGLDFWRTSPPPPAAVDGGFNPLWFIGGEEASPPPPPPTLFTRFTNVFKREPEPEPEPEPESKAFYFFEKEELAAREKAIPFSHAAAAVQPAGLALQAEAGARSAVEPKLVAGRASLFHAGLGCVALGAVLLAGLARWRAKQPSQRQINLV